MPPPIPHSIPVHLKKRLSSLSSSSSSPSSSSAAGVTSPRLSISSFAYTPNQNQNQNRQPSQPHRRPTALLSQSQSQSQSQPASPLHLHLSTSTTPALTRYHPFSTLPPLRSAAHDEHEHESRFDPPSGWLFGVRPGEKEEREGWEGIWVWGFWGSLGLAVVGYCFKPDTSIQTWALEEARRRLEAEGILPDPTDPKRDGLVTGTSTGSSTSMSMSSSSSTMQ